MKTIQVGDLVKHLANSMKGTFGVVTAVKFYHETQDYSYEVLWSSGRHSTHEEKCLMQLEVI